MGYEGSVLTIFQKAQPAEPFDSEKHAAAMAKVLKQAIELREKNAALRASRDVEAPRRELDDLKKEKFRLEIGVTSTRQKVANCEADIREFQNRITGLLKKKKRAVADGRLGDERACERQIVSYEEELAGAQLRLISLERDRVGAEQDLKNFNHARLTELQNKLA